MEGAWAACAGAVVILAGLCDWRTRKIPNILPGVLAALALAQALWAGSVEALGWREALVVFAVGLVLFRCGFIGGGDVKLLCACALCLPGRGAVLVGVSALAGGILALLYLAHGFFVGRRPGEVPYGIAIGLAALVEFARPVAAWRPFG